MQPYVWMNDFVVNLIKFWVLYRASSSKLLHIAWQVGGLYKFFASLCEPNYVPTIRVNLCNFQTIVFAILLSDLKVIKCWSFKSWIKLGLETRRHVIRRKNTKKKYGN